jgi:phosphoglucosamine mutase
MTRHWFGTDGIRCRAGSGPLATPFLVRLGRAMGEQVLEEDPQGESHLALLARDTRESGPAISSALAEGLTLGGMTVVDLGVLPTPGLAMAMRARGAQRGIVVSASHNPWQDNGVKTFGPGGHKLTDDQEHALERRVVALGGEDDLDVPAELEAGEVAPPPRVVHGAQDYIRATVERFRGLDLTGFTLAVDCAHGAASETAPAVFRELGAEVTTLACEPDGRNINDGCGSTYLEGLAEAMTDGGYDLGIAFDGDADRVLMVDGQGRTCTGDHMLGFLGSWLSEKHELLGDTVVATVMSNLGLERMLTAHRIRLMRTDVGDRYVHAAMREGSFGFGGEASGHLLFGAENDFTGDGLYTALRMLEGLVDTGRRLEEVVDAIPVVPQVLINVPTNARPPLDRLPGLTARVAEAEAEHGDRIRIVLRYSGTENLARVMVEGLDDGIVHALADELALLWGEQVTAYGQEGAPA